MDLFFIFFFVFFSTIGIVDTIKYVFTKIFRVPKDKITTSMENSTHENVKKNILCQLVRIDDFDNETPKVIDITSDYFEIQHLDK